MHLIRSNNKIFQFNCFQITRNSRVIQFFSKTFFRILHLETSSFLYQHAFYIYFCSRVKTNRTKRLHFYFFILIFYHQNHLRANVFKGTNVALSFIFLLILSLFNFSIPKSFEITHFLGELLIFVNFESDCRSVVWEKSVGLDINEESLFSFERKRTVQFFFDLTQKFHSIIFKPKECV